MAFNALHNGVTNHDLVKSLALDPVTTMPQVLDCCYQYANMFDIMKARKAVDGKVPEKKRASEKDEKSKDTKRARSDRDQSPDYTPLNTTRTKILMEVYDRGLLQWPRPMFSNPEDRNKNKYCKFHRDVGHDTENYRQLKREIEDVIQKGHLKRYVKEDTKDNPRGRDTMRNVRGRDDRARRGDDRDRQGNRRDDQREVRGNRDEANTSPTPAILTILGGPGQESARKAKAKARFVGVAEVPEKRARTEPEITFSDKDMEGLSWPHDDAVVVQVVIANRPVHRILVDMGASVDMLSYDAYLQFRIELGTLKPEAAPLYGFLGAPAPIEGSVELLLTVGTVPCQKTIKVNFVVVRVATAYNAILGRPSLNELGTVVSTKHLKVKFSTLNGVGKMPNGAEESLGMSHCVPERHQGQL
ncbi:uncharacterized protein LOC122659365 [Telopea speciosissima]|uniref:uncharacterized protein LOC122659365 n=1 Tax=Telopea speciosissima TaxID=54955 RepID=UPI001CC6CB4C|nr:uncharacterized protein LOC122659365 [Telopea speciosissima]